MRLLFAITIVFLASTASAAELELTPSREPLNVRTVLEAGGTVGAIILVLSIAMVALIVEHLLSLRRRALMPNGLADEVRRLVQQGAYRQAEATCAEDSSFLGQVLAAGLAEAQIGYAAVEKAMEDESRVQAARLHRKIEYLALTSKLAPIIGLVGTVWGLIVVFHDAAPSAKTIVDLAPGISNSLVTTLFGFAVALPAITCFAFLRNRIDALVAATADQAEHALAHLKQRDTTRLLIRKPYTATMQVGAEAREHV